MRLNRNLDSLRLYRAQSRVIEKQNNALNRITSGVKVSAAKDDPNALAQSERLNLQIRATQMAQKNVQDGVSMLQTAEGAMEEMTSMLQRVKQLAVQAGDGSYSPEEKTTVQNEINQMIEGMDNIATFTDFNGIKMLYDTNVTDNSKPGLIPSCTGANAKETIEVPTFNFKISDLIVKDSSGNDKKFSTLDVTNSGGVDESLSMIDSAINMIVSARSQYGALENRFESQYNSLGEISEGIEEAQSSLIDSDVAKEIMEYTKGSILSQSGTAMMAQSNKFPQDVLSILQNVLSR